MAEKGHGGGHAEHAEHGGGHAHAEHGADHGHGGHGKEKKEGFLKSVSKQLRNIFNVTALFSLSLFVSEGIAKPIAYEAAKGTMTTAPSIVGEAASKVPLSGGGGSHSGGGSHGHAPAH